MIQLVRRKHSKSCAVRGVRVAVPPSPPERRRQRTVAVFASPAVAWWLPSRPRCSAFRSTSAPKKKRTVRIRFVPFRHRRPRNPAEAHTRIYSRSVAMSCICMRRPRANVEDTARKRRNVGPVERRSSLQRLVAKGEPGEITVAGRMREQKQDLSTLAAELTMKYQRPQGHETAQPAGSGNLTPCRGAKGLTSCLWPRARKVTRLDPDSVRSYSNFFAENMWFWRTNTAPANSDCLVYLHTLSWSSCLRALPRWAMSPPNILEQVKTRNRSHIGDGGRVSVGDSN